MKPAHLKLLQSALFVLMAAQLTFGRQIPELDSEPDLVKRSQRALVMADSFFEDARQAYTSNEIKKGDTRLEEMTKALNVCVAALNAVHKSRLFKPAEMRVMTLSRRLHTLVGDLSVDDRGWAEYTERQVEAVHEKLLLGVMKK